MARGELEDLVKRSASGDREALEELAQRAEGPVRAAIRPRLGPALRGRVDTDDILQSTIAAAIGDLRDFEYRGDRAFVAWLTRVAEHRILMAARHHRAGKRDLKRDRPLEAAAAVVGEATSPSQGAIRGEVTKGLHRAVDRLPEPDRSVVRLHSFEGLDFKDVATQAGLSDKNQARYVFQRALKRIGDLLAGEAS